MDTALELVGNFVKCPEEGIIFKVTITKNTNKNSMMSIMGIISIRAFLLSR